MRNGAVPIELQENGDDESYSLGTSALGDGDSIAISFALVHNGRYKIRFVESGSGYLLGTTNG